MRGQSQQPLHHKNFLNVLANRLLDTRVSLAYTKETTTRYRYYFLFLCGLPAWFLVGRKSLSAFSAALEQSKVPVVVQDHLY